MHYHSMRLHRLACLSLRWRGYALQVMRVPEANLYPVPDEVADKSAAQFSVGIPVTSQQYSKYQHDRLSH